MIDIMAENIDQCYAQIDVTDPKIDREKIPYRIVPGSPDCPYCKTGAAIAQYRSSGLLWYRCSTCLREFSEDKIVSTLRKWAK